MTSERDLSGTRGELLFHAAVILPARGGRIFEAVYLGGKWPSFDYLIEP